MEQLVSYETAKHLVVYTGVCMILAIDIWFIIFTIKLAFKWAIRKVKSIKSNLKRDAKEETDQQL